MKAFKKITALLLALLISAGFACTAFAQDDLPEDGTAEAEDAPALEGLDTSAIDGKMFAYLGIETYFVVYPEPDEALPNFDITKAEVTCSEEGIVKAEIDKVEEYRYGSINITGLKLGRTTVTVTDPESGISCNVQVTALPSFGYRLINFIRSLDYLPYFLFMRIVSIIGKEAS